MPRAAAAADATVHFAFKHDFDDLAGAIATERGVVAALLDALAGTGRTLIATFGTAFVAPGRTLVEADAPAREGPNGRAAIEHTLLGGAARGFRPMVMRLPFSAHGRGDRGFVPFLISVAREHNAAVFLGDGTNRWPAVHRDDAARAYRSALERGEPGARFHAVAEPGIPFRRIADAIAAGTGVAARSVTPAEAEPILRWASRFAGADAPTASNPTRTALGWTPTGPDLLSDLRASGYFDR